MQNGNYSNKLYLYVFCRLSNVGIKSVLKLSNCLILMLQKASLEKQFLHYFGYHRIIFLFEEYVKAVKGQVESECLKSH